jgi:hypothetical protein
MATFVGLDVSLKETSDADWPRELLDVDLAHACSDGRGPSRGLSRCPVCFGAET